jgi:hypothetical protein
MSAVTMSGEANSVRPANTRGLTNGQVRVAVNSPSKTETMAAAKEPAAVVNESLKRLNAKPSELVMGRVMAGATKAAADRTVSDAPSARTASIDDPSKSMLAQQVQMQIGSEAEIAILAQANQLPNDALAFSTSE